MKAPRIAFSKDAVLSFLLLHGEKVVAAMVGLAACGLAWGGIGVFRTMGPKPEQLPPAIIKDAADTAEHIEAVKIDSTGWAFGVQWHPEDNYDTERGQLEIFEQFVRAAS